MIVFFIEEINGSQANLINEEFTHCIKVLRHQVNDLIHLVDGQGKHYEGTILSIEKKKCLIKLLKTTQNSKPAPSKAIVIAPTKNISRYEWFLEKATEIGVTDIYPVLYKQSERKHIKAERSKKIIRTAFKQSLRFFEPKLHPLTSFEQFIKLGLEHDQRIIAHYNENNPSLEKLIDREKSAIVLIGPEGDFRDEEIKLAKENGYQEVNISKNRLRTETAGVVALNFIV